MRHSTRAARAACHFRANLSALMSETCFGHYPTQGLKHSKLTALSLEQLCLSSAGNLLCLSPAVILLPLSPVLNLLRLSPV